MKSKTTRSFRELLRSLPSELRERANEAYSHFCLDPHYPALRFKRVHSTKPIYSARVTLDYRAVGIQSDDTIVWFWIGKHDDYEKLLTAI
jgi:hypothetical protein